MIYTLDIEKVKALSKKAGIKNLGALCQKASIHPNSITPYIKQQRSPFTQVIVEIARTLNVPATELLTTAEAPSIALIKDKIIPVLDASHAIFLFGSRARNTQQEFSDIDLGITGGKSKIEFSKFSKIKSTFEVIFENFHLSVNLANLDLAPMDFLAEIEPDLKFICGNEHSADFFMGFIDGRKTN